MASELVPDLGEIAAGTDVRLTFNVTAQSDSSTVDYTGASGTATLSPVLDASFTKSITLDNSPNQQPQVHIDLLPGDTSSLITPQRVYIEVKMTTATGSIQKLFAHVDVVDY